MSEDMREAREARQVEEPPGWDMLVATWTRAEEPDRSQLPPELRPAT